MAEDKKDLKKRPVYSVANSFSPEEIRELAAALNKHEVPKEDTERALIRDRLIGKVERMQRRLERLPPKPVTASERRGRALLEPFTMSPEARQKLREARKNKKRAAPSPAAEDAPES